MVDSVAPHTRSVEALLHALQTTRAGLSEEEAASRLPRYGPNSLPPPPRASALRILLDQCRSVVVLLLVMATAVSLLLGDAIEAIAIVAVLVINTVIGFSTEIRARRAMEAILTLDVPRAKVVRAGHLRIVDAPELVPGDVIEVGAGDQVPADARLAASTDLRTNEAALTGESLPSSKRADPIAEDNTPLGDRFNMVYSGTTVAAGTGQAVVTATGRSTEVGRIGELLGRVTIEPTPLERRLDALGHRLVWLTLGVAALVSGLGPLHGESFEVIVQTGIALAVAAVPEALPAVATIALAVGLRRMAARNALVRRLPAVEALGSTTVVCTDKTRTLTSGDMAVVRIWAAGRAVTLDPSSSESELSGEAKRVLEIAVLASTRPAAAAEDASRGGAAVDPVDRAVIEAAERAGIDHIGLLSGDREALLVPFSSERKFMARVHDRNGERAASIKGAPGRVLDRCALDEAARRALVDTNNALARQGLRVLAVASGRVRDAREDALEGLSFGGFLGLADPPAAGVKDAIARLRAAGLRTVLLTGDQRLTAEAIGRELGVVQPGDRVVEGRELDAESPEALSDATGHAAVFSRITPEHKLRIVEAFQARGEIVAMLGDGVNDAPALRRADVGVAMGTRGTDVAKQAAAIVLRDDRFDTIVGAVEEGRVIFDNIRKFVLYLFSCNVAEVLVLLAAGVSGLPLPLLPMQLLWLNIITDTFPALALAMEPPEVDVMQRGPRSPDEALLSAGTLRDIAVFGGLITLSTLAAFLWALRSEPAAANTVAFMTLAFAQIAHLGNARSTGAVLGRQMITANPYALGAVAVSTGLQMATLVVDPLPELLRIAPLSSTAWAVVIGCAAIPAVAGQAIKSLRRVL